MPVHLLVTFIFFRWSPSKNSALLKSLDGTALMTLAPLLASSATCWSRSKPGASESFWCAQWAIQFPHQQVLGSQLVQSQAKLRPTRAVLHTPATGPTWWSLSWPTSTSDLCLNRKTFFLVASMADHSYVPAQAHASSVRYLVGLNLLISFCFMY